MSARDRFEEVVVSSLPMIRRIAAAYESNGHLAEELAQDIACAVWLALPSFRGDAAPKTFVARIATNRAVSHVRRTLSRPRLAQLSEDLPAAEPTPEALAIARDGRERLVLAVRRLPLALRQVALLTLEGFAAPEVGAVLGISDNAVRVRLSRAKAALQHTMGDVT
jgi:RNA polymerase sigma-70 factor (ECF subfamily)